MVPYIFTIVYHYDIILWGDFTMEYMVCSKCKNKKPKTLEFFARNPNNKDRLTSKCRDCVNKHAREWNKRNRDKCNMAAKKWRDKNPHKTKEYSQRYYENNIEKIKIKDREYRENNKEKIIKRRKEYASNNREKIMESAKRWHEENREYAHQRAKEWRKSNYQRYRENIDRWRSENRDKVRSYYHKRRNVELSLPHTLTPEEWTLAKWYFESKCAYCGKSHDILCQDHFVPVSNGGGYVQGNIVPACRKCNSSKNDSNFYDWYLSLDTFNLERFLDIEAFMEYHEKQKEPPKEYTW